ncbi:MAG: capsule biosynthesis GfcC D2 domain-containing protein, partial [Acinetobacter sp.]
MKKIIFSLLIGYTPWLHADSIIQVISSHTPQTQISLSDTQRLERLLNDPNLPSDIYWPAAIISSPAEEHLAQQAKERLLGDLKSLQILWMRSHQGGLVQATQQLLRELDQLDVTGRINMMLDPDLSRIEPANNPRLTGEYSLYVSARPSNLYLLGLINSRKSLTHERAKGLAEYWQGHSLLT